jgi:conjugal transfer/entry exclusion protein
MKAVLRVVACLAGFSFALHARAQTTQPTNQLAHEIFKQLIEINTTDSVGNVTTAAEAMAARLRDAGFTDKDVVVAGPNDRKKKTGPRTRFNSSKKTVSPTGAAPRT